MDDAPVRTGAVDTEAAGIGLLDLPFAALEVPDDNRPNHAEPPEAIPFGPWSLVRATPEGSILRADLPIRTRALFFHSPVADMHLKKADGTVIPHARDSGGKLPHWRWTATDLDLTWPANESFEGITLHYQRATQREQSLNLAFSGEEAEDFVAIEMQTRHSSKTGLLLPAPGLAEWEITIPEAAELHFTPTIIPPEILDAEPSDGAQLTVEIDVGDHTTAIWSEHVDVGSDTQLHVDLTPWTGEQVTLRFRSEPGATERFDYVFIGEPAVTPRRTKPRRVVMVFVDTLRPDHLGPYGYERDTSPALSALAERGTVFDSTRSIAPWTLPSARAALTGRQPEWYGATPTLASRFRAEGWTTAMFAGNVYLSANFEMTDDWGYHQVENWPDAEVQVDRALKWLDAQQGRDAFLVLHLMDPHLPYQEPETHAALWAGDAPSGLEGAFHLPAARRVGRDEKSRQYIIDRYDQNVRYADDELSRLYATLTDDDVFVFFSDHGEEFWEHGGFEHGHTLYDELLHVPLIVRGPEIPAGRISEPTSLLDIAPTVLAMAGIDAGDSFDGVNLVPAAKGDRDALTALASRDLAFGRPLYGNTQWGVLHGTEKYTSKEGVEHLFELDVDPGEQLDRLRRDHVVQTEIHQQRMSNALGTHVGPAYRLQIKPIPTRSYTDAIVEIDVPGGVLDAFGKDDTAGFARLSVDVHTIAEVGAELDCNDCSTRIDRVRVTIHGGYKGGTEVFIHPEAPISLVTHALRLRGTWDDDEIDVTVPGNAMTGPSNSTATIVSAKLGSRGLGLGFAIVPAPPEGGRELKGHDSELDEMLQAMGYAVGEGGEDHPTEERCGNSQDDDGDEKIDEGCD